MTTAPLDRAVYEDVYAGRTILIKVSGAEIASRDFPRACRDIRRLVAEGLRVILVAGGGEQIDIEYRKRTGKAERPKRDGVGITTTEVLEKGVLPAYATITRRIGKLCPHAIIVPPSAVHARAKGKVWGFVGNPTKVAFDNRAPLSIIGFVGQTEDGQLMNVNADEIAVRVVQQFPINTVIFATKTGGVLDTAKSLVRFISQKRVRDCIRGTHPTIEAVGGMKKKLIEVERLLRLVDKVVITNLNGIDGEINKLEGTGTLCGDLRRAVIAPCREPRIFELAYRRYTKEGLWKKRTGAEKKQARETHRTLLLDGSPLGGFSLIARKHPLDRKRDAIELSCLWANATRNGIGRMLLTAARREARIAKRSLFLFTREDISPIAPDFHRHEGVTSTTGATLWTRN